MPVPLSPIRDPGGDSGGTDLLQKALGVQAPPPAPPTAPPTLGAAPTVSSTPQSGQGIATDSAGRIGASVAAQAVPVFTADPANPTIGQVWYRADTSQLCIRHNATTTKRATFA